MSDDRDWLGRVPESDYLKKSYFPPTDVGNTAQPLAPPTTDQLPPPPPSDDD